MLIARCPNCRAKYNATQEMIDSYGGFFRCGKCDTKFNYYDQFSSPSENENITGFSRENEHEDTDLGEHTAELYEDKESWSDNDNNDFDTQEPKLNNDSTEEGHNITFNHYDDIDDEISEPKLTEDRSNLNPIVGLEDAAENELEAYTSSVDSFDVSSRYIEEDDLKSDIYELTHAGENIEQSVNKHDAKEEIKSLYVDPEIVDMESDEAMLSGKSDTNIGQGWFNPSLSDEEGDAIDRSLIVELEQEYQQERKAVLGDGNPGINSDELENMLTPTPPTIEPAKNENKYEYNLNILDDVEEDTKVIGNVGAVWLGIKHTIWFFFWSLIILALVALLIYQFKPRLSSDLQNKIDNSPIVEYLCKYAKCKSKVESDSLLEVVVSRMDLYPTPSEPLNISLFILNRLKEVQRYPIIKLSLKNLQGLTVGQRFYKPADYLDNPHADIPAGNIGKVVLKLENPPEKAVGFEVSLL